MAKKLKQVTKEEYDVCNEFNKMVVEEFLSMSNELSDQTLKQYKSGMVLWINWVRINVKNKPIHELKAKDFARYMAYLYNEGLSDSAMRFKRSAVSTVNNHIMLYYDEDYPTFKNFVSKNIKTPITGEVHKKLPLNPQEYQDLCDELETKGEWQKLAYVKMSYCTGARKSEIRALKKEIVDYEPNIKMVTTKDEDGNSKEIEAKIFSTHPLRCKGRGKLGKIRKMQFDQDTMDFLRKWMDFRGEDDCEFLFVNINKSKGTVRQVSDNTFNNWCSNLFTKIVGRRVHPHLFRESRATNLVVHSGKNIEVAQKLLGHVSSEVTKLYVVRDDEDDADEAFV